MSKKKNAEDITNFQLFILILISIAATRAFILFTLSSLSINSFLSTIISCLVCCAMLFCVVVFYLNLALYKKSFTSWIALAITGIVFLLVPALMQMAYRSNAQAYLDTEPQSDSISVKITYGIVTTDRSGSIGNNWTYKHFINGTSFKSGDVVQLEYKSSFSITSRFTEIDDAYSDVGKATSSEYSFAENNNYKKVLTISQNVHVVENGGRKNAKSYADFSVTYSLKRVVPTDMSFFDLLLWKNTAYGIVLIAFEIGALLLTAFVLINGSKKKRAAEEAERNRMQQRLLAVRKEKEQQLIEERNAFIDSLGGKTIRDAAGVPANITFIHGLPKDNNDQRYGTFTVYCSKRGSCFHQKSGCCSAIFERHIFNVIGQYKPCSKCCTKHFEIPKWYKDYNNLKAKAREYGLPIDE